MRAVCGWTCTKSAVMTVRTASDLLADYMRACGFSGWASFWNTVYVLPGFEHNQRLLRHERCHLTQIERDGRLLFALRYPWLTLRYVYHMNQYEVEARAGESKNT